MKPVFVRELKELSPALVPILAFGVIAGASFAGELPAQLGEILAVSCIGGVFLGCFHGGLDRWRRSDLFTLHRPISAVRMEAARTLAGVTVALLGIPALVVAHRYSTLSHIARDRGLRALGIVFESRSWDQLGALEIALLTGFALATWVVTRFAVGAIRLRWALPALVVVPFVCWSFLARTGVAATISFTLGLAVIFSFGALLCLAGDRR